MASVRLAVVETAQQLALDAYDGMPAAVDGYVIPAETIVRIRRAASLGQRPESVLRWAWRSQTARYVDSRSFIDGVATMYLLAALLEPDVAPGNEQAPVSLVQ